MVPNGLTWGSEIVQTHGVDNTERKFDNQKQSEPVLIPVVGNKVRSGDDAISTQSQQSLITSHSIDSRKEIMALCDARARTRFRKKWHTDQKMTVDKLAVRRLSS